MKINVNKMMSRDAARIAQVVQDDEYVNPFICTEKSDIALQTD